MKRATSDRLGFKSFNRRNLPHIQPLDTTLFLTFRLAGSLPEGVLAKMAEERRMIERTLKANDNKSGSHLGELARRHFLTIESWLHKATSGPTWLADGRIAVLVAESLPYRDDSDYRLDAYSIMPNHVHAVFAPSGGSGVPKSLSAIMHSLKRNTAKRANRVLNRTGSFWEHESFDHYVRNQAEWRRIVNYVLENPVKAGLVKNWREWPWNYLREE